MSEGRSSERRFLLLVALATAAWQSIVIVPAPTLLNMCGPGDCVTIQLVDGAPLLLGPLVAARRAPPRGWLRPVLRALAVAAASTVAVVAIMAAAGLLARARFEIVRAVFSIVAVVWAYAVWPVLVALAVAVFLAARPGRGGEPPQPGPSASP